MGYGGLVSRSIHRVFVVLEQIGDSELLCSKIEHAVWYSERGKRNSG